MSDETGGGPARSSAEGGAKLIDKTGEGPARSSAEGGAKLIDRKLQALVIDDVPVNVKLLTTLLRAHGFTVESADSAEAALPMLATGQFGLLLLDLRLPGMDGLSLARELRGQELHAELIIVAVTANAMKRDQEAALAAGCDAFVSKPINTRTLVPMLTSLLARGRTA